MQDLLGRFLFVFQFMRILPLQKKIQFWAALCGATPHPLNAPVRPTMAFSRQNYDRGQQTQRDAVSSRLRDWLQFSTYQCVEDRCM